MSELPSPTCPICGDPATVANEAGELAILTRMPTGVRVGYYQDANLHRWETRWTQQKRATE